MSTLDVAYRAAQSGAAVFDLSPRGKIRITGKDARTWLHNLCTNDVQNLAAARYCEAFFTTPKARVISYTLLFAVEEGFLIDTPSISLPVLMRHLNLHIISEDVTVGDVSSQWGHLRILGPDSANRIKAVLGDGATVEQPLAHRSVASGASEARVVNLEGLGLTGFDLHVAAEETAALRDNLIRSGGVAGDAEAMEVLRVEAGLPEFGKDIDENRLVMEVGRTAQAISYSKGCYLGQEPIVMARDRGQVNRTLLGLKVAEGDPLTAGVRLFSGENEVGQATSSVRSPRFGAIALAYLRRGHQQPGKELIVEPATDGRRVKVAALPFAE